MKHTLIIVEYWLFNFGIVYWCITLASTSIGIEYRYRIGTWDGVVNRQNIFSYQVVLSADTYYFR